MAVRSPHRTAQRTVSFSPEQRPRATLGPPQPRARARVPCQRRGPRLHHRYRYRHRRHHRQYRRHRRQRGCLLRGRRVLTGRQLLARPCRPVRLRLQTAPSGRPKHHRAPSRPRSGHLPPPATPATSLVPRSGLRMLPRRPPARTATAVIQARRPTRRPPARPGQPTTARPRQTPWRPAPVSPQPELTRVVADGLTRAPLFRPARCAGSSAVSSPGRANARWRRRRSR
jgi:hypothetical protein